jgi:uncharacterized protein with von Willebrand factor type A (vWA) domain
MFIDLFYKLRSGGIPVSITEYLSLLSALDKGVAELDIDAFYYLMRTALVKDEKYFDRFDRIFGAYYEGMEDLLEDLIVEIPEEWLERQKDLNLTEEEKRQIEAMGGWEKLMETLRERLNEQKEAHHGGNKWIGTGGKSPYGAYGYNPEGVRIGQSESRHKKAVKVWDKRDFRNFDDSVEIGTRNMKIALTNLRKFAR